MKLGEGGEAFFVFETTDDIPASLQTSPLVSPASSPKVPSDDLESFLQEPEYLDLEKSGGDALSEGAKTPPTMPFSRQSRATTDLGMADGQVLSNAEVSNSRVIAGTITPLSRSPAESDLGPPHTVPFNSKPALDHSMSENILSTSVPTAPGDRTSMASAEPTSEDDAEKIDRSRSPPPVSAQEAMDRATSLSKKLSGSNIPSHVNETGDLMLDMTGYKSNEEDALRAEILARKILAEELEGSYDIGALIGADEHGNLWIYSSEEAKEAADRRATINSMRPNTALSEDAISDPGYHSEGDHSTLDPSMTARHHRTKSDVQPGFPTPPHSPLHDSFAVETRNYAKTLRLTSDQLKALELKPGPNTMSFSVNKATCTASMYLWSGNTPILISDIDGTITKYVHLQNIPYI